MKKKGTNLIEMKIAYTSNKSNISNNFLIKYFFLSSNILLLTCYFILMAWNIYLSFILELNTSSMKNGNIYKKIYNDIKKTTVLQELYIADNVTLLYDSKRNYSESTEKIVATDICNDMFNKSNIFNLFDDITSLSNICYEYDEFEKKHEIKYDRYCDKVLNINNTVRLYSYNSKFFCYKSYPRKRYVLKYKPIVESCNKNEIQCGVSGKDYKICMELDENIRKCPIVDIIPLLYTTSYKINPSLSAKERYYNNAEYMAPTISFFNSIKIEDEEKGEFAESFIFEHVDADTFSKAEINNKKNITLSQVKGTTTSSYYFYNDAIINYRRGDDKWDFYLKRFTDESTNKLSVNLLIETSNFERFNNQTDGFDFYMKKRKIFENEMNFNILRGDRYISNFDNNLSSTSILSRIRLSFTDVVRANAFREFLSQFPPDFKTNYYLGNIDEDTEIMLDRKYIFYPNSTCINSVFIPFKLDQNILKSTTYIVMDFLDIISSLNQTWVICQIVISLIFLFYYEINVLVKKINEKFYLYEVKNETYTVITLKFLQYFCFVTRFVILFQGKRILDDKINFLNEINKNNCYSGLNGLLFRAFQNSPLLISIGNTINVIFMLMIIEIGIEVISLLHFNIEKFFLNK